MEANISSIVSNLPLWMIHKPKIQATKSLLPHTKDREIHQTLATGSGKPYGGVAIPAVSGVTDGSDCPSSRLGKPTNQQPLTLAASSPFLTDINLLFDISIDTFVLSSPPNSSRGTWISGNRSMIQGPSTQGCWRPCRLACFVPPKSGDPSSPFK